jgi:hypothetical protein
MFSFESWRYVHFITPAQDNVEEQYHYLSRFQRIRNLHQCVFRAERNADIAV